MVTQGKITYVISYRFSNSDRDLVLRLTHNPEDRSSFFEVRFSNIRNFAESRDDDFDPELLRDIVGINVYERDDCSEVFIRLYDTEFSFRTKEDPVLINPS